MQNNKSLEWAKQKSRVIAKTQFKNGETVVSVLFPFPTVKLAELRTHRKSIQTDAEYLETSENDKIAAMNANSSRAIPIMKQIEAVKNMPYVPIWTHSQSGMQGKEVTDERTIKHLNEAYLSRLNASIEEAEFYAKNDIHKQDACLPIVRYSFTTVVMTMTEWQWNYFFKQRTADAVYPFFRELFRYIENIVTETKPTRSNVHLPFRAEIEAEYGKEITAREAMLIACSMCAKISFDTQDKVETIRQHVERAERLIKAKHAIDEHVALPNDLNLDNPLGKKATTLRAMNLAGFSFV